MIMMYTLVSMILIYYVLEYVYSSILKDSNSLNTSKSSLKEISWTLVTMIAFDLVGMICGIIFYVILMMNWSNNGFLDDESTISRGEDYEREQLEN
jgi:hypothetical protein